MLDRSPFQKVLIERCPTSIEQDYCCHAYALQVHTNEKVLKNHELIFVDLNINGELKTGLFYQFLFKKNALIQINNEEELLDDDLILYFIKDKHLTHSGRMKNGRVVSKWGGRAKHPATGETLLGGDVWMHHWEDVPQDYMLNHVSVRLFRLTEGISSEQIAEILLEFMDDLQSKLSKQ